jgi:TolA-binding protein
VKEYPPLAYVPVHEPVRLWQLMEPIRSDGVAPAVHVEDDGDPEHLFALGMKGFDGGRCDDAQPYFDTVLARHPRSERAEDAAYFRAICFFRDHDWRGTIDAFQSLIRDYPNGRWVAGAHYHIGLCHAELHDPASARTAFETVRDRFSQQDSVVRLARERLAEMDAQKSILERSLGWLGLR